MDTIMCNEHFNGMAVDARTRVYATTGLAIATSWAFVTKPSGNQRPSGAPPG
ncbi:MAG: hypothetical protein R8F63_15450 [Acidimicrobiales bacterium]|nr:hypothetical protein [Acidimicrobiales bacterium]